MKMPFARIQGGLDGILGHCSGDLDEAFDRIHRTLSNVRLPSPVETAAVAIATPKIAALCYDRIWRGLSVDMPEEIAFHGATDAEHEFLGYAFVLDHFAKLAEDENPYVQLNATIVKNKLDRLPDDSNGTMSLNGGVTRSIRSLAEHISAAYGVRTTAVYDAVSTRDLEYASGDYAAIVATISSLGIPVEERLKWEQVVEFRRDPASRRKFRRFVHWLDRDMVGRSASFISDEVSVRLADYHAAMRKHGIEVALGTLSAVLDSKVLLGGAAAIASLSYLTEPPWALIAGGSIVCANAAVHIGRTLLDIREVRENTAKDIALVTALEEAANDSK